MVIVIGGGERGARAHLQHFLHFTGEASFPVIPRGAESSQLTHRRGFPVFLFFGAPPGAPWAPQRDGDPQPGLGAHPHQDSQISIGDVLWAWRVGIVSCFSFNVKPISWKLVLPH